MKLSEMTIDDKVVFYLHRMLRHRLDDNKDFKDWCSDLTLYSKAEEKIRKYLEEGRTIIKTGWTPSDCRGYHHYYIIYK